MNLSELIVDLRVELNMPSATGRFSNNNIAQLMNRAKDLIARRIISHDQRYLETSKLIDFVADTREYDMPAELYQGRISYVERLNADGTVLRRCDPIVFQERERWETSNSGLPQAGQVYYIRDRKLGFVPTPTSALTSAVRVYGPQFPPDMVWAALPSGWTTGATTVVMPVATHADMKAGRPDSRLDYYKNCVLRMVTGTNTGSEKTISAYAPSTRTLTFPALTATAADEYVLLTTLPEDKYREAIKAYAAMKIAYAQGDWAAFKAAQSIWQSEVPPVAGGDLDDDIKPRHFDQPEYILPPVDGME